MVDVGSGCRACQQHVPIQMKRGSFLYLLQHHGLLLLKQRLELLRREDLLLKDLLHLLRCDHLRTHHGHRHWNLGHKNEREGEKVDFCELRHNRQEKRQIGLNWKRTDH